MTPETGDGLDGVPACKVRTDPSEKLGHGGSFLGAWLSPQLRAVSTSGQSLSWESFLLVKEPSFPSTVACLPFSRAV